MRLPEERRTTERNDAHERENLIDPGPLADVSEKDAKAARRALIKSTPEKIVRPKRK
jgi:hypothetical protein